MEMIWTLLLPFAEQLGALGSALLLALLLAVTGLIYQGLNYLGDTVFRRALERAVREAQEVAKDAIHYANQVYVDAIRESRENGKLKPEEQKAALSKAVEYFISHISSNAWGILLSSQKDVVGWIGDFIESQLRQVKVEEEDREVVRRVLEMSDPKS